MLRKKVQDLVKEATSGGEYTQVSLKFDPMGGKDRWLMFEFVGADDPAIKLSTLSGPYAARGIEVWTLTTPTITCYLLNRGRRVHR